MQKTVHEFNLTWPADKGDSMNCPLCGFALDKVLGCDDAYVCYTVGCPVTRVEGEQNKKEENKDEKNNRI